MSHNLTPTPGLHRVDEKGPKALAVKVTGRNLGAIAYIVALFAEGSEQAATVGAQFDIDGSLLHVQVDGTFILPGQYLVLTAEWDEIFVFSPDEYAASFERVDA